MSWILWAILLSLGCIFLVFLMSCLRMAKDADEKIDELGPSSNIKHERLKENIPVGSCVSPTMEIKRQAKKEKLLAAS